MVLLITITQFCWSVLILTTPFLLHILTVLSYHAFRPTHIQTDGRTHAGRAVTIRFLTVQIFNEHTHNYHESCNISSIQLKKLPDGLIFLLDH
jgi:hypothetical protein